MSPTRIPPTTGAISRRGRTWPSSSRARATSTGRRNCSRRTRNGTQAGRRRDQPSSWSNRCAAKRCWPPPGARRSLTRGDLPSPRRAWPWSRCEESPRGEEPRAAGAERRGGIRGAAEAASGRAARRCARRAQIPRRRGARAWPRSRCEESPSGEEPRAAGAERRGGIRGAAEAASGRAARRCARRAQIPRRRGARAWPRSRCEESPRGEAHRAAGAERRGGIRGAAEAASGRAARRCARRAQIPRRRGATVMDRDFQTQHKLLLLETLYDAGLSLGSLPDEEALVEDVLGRAVGVLDASRGYLATFGEGGARRAEARVGFPRRPSESVVAEDEFLRDLLSAETALAREKFRFLRTAVSAAIGVPIRGGGRTVGVLVLADKELRRGGQTAFEQEDARFLTSLAGLCGMAIENRRHLERLTRERERLEEENRRLLDETGRVAAGRLFVGDSPAVRRVLDLVGRVAPSRTSVLITGESGTGKELVARMIHARSERADKPFVAINCAALPESLLESELFGIERGVATGVEARSGRFETASGGTLFLDEVGDMPLALQAKLLRVLQEREIERVGGRKHIPIDVRVLAATNARLTEKIVRGEFREDLYYRLRVVEIALPPLRDRREDIPKLARHFLERFAAREGRDLPTIDRDAFAALLAHDFAGNIRELENLLEGAASLCRGGVIRREDLQWLPLRVPGKFEVSPGTETAEVPNLRALEERHIRSVLKMAGGNKSRAARLLGISRRTLYRKKTLGR